MGTRDCKKNMFPKPSRRREFLEKLKSYEKRSNPSKFFIHSLRFSIPEPTPSNLSVKPEKSNLIEPSHFSDEGPSTGIFTLRIVDLTQSCISEFEVCVRYEKLMEHRWAENRFADFNIFINGVGALSSSWTSLDYRLKNRPDDQTLVKSILSMLKDFLKRCITEADANRDTNEAMMNVDSSLENLNLIAVTIRKTSKRSPHESADNKFIPEEHGELQDLMRILCLRQLTWKETKSGVETAQAAVERTETTGKHESGHFQFYNLTTEECIDSLKRLQLSEPQKRLLGANMRRRNRFLFAQRHSEGPKASPSKVSLKLDISQERDLFQSDKGRRNLKSTSLTKFITFKSDDQSKHSTRPNSAVVENKSSTADRSLQVLRANEEKSMPARTAMTAPKLAVEYPQAPRISQDMKMFKCPCCCENLPSEFGTNKELWKRHLTEDIAPYICILPDCPRPTDTFTTVFDWEKHSRTEHRPCRICPLCERTNAVFLEEEDLVRHMKDIHSSVLSAEFIATALSWSEVLTIGVNECPLCKTTGLGYAPDFIEHVLNCMHDFALYSLPWADEDENTSQHVWDCNPDMIPEPDREKPMLESFQALDDLHSNRDTWQPITLERWYNTMEDPITVGELPPPLDESEATELDWASTEEHGTTCQCSKCLRGDVVSDVEDVMKFDLRECDTKEKGIHWRRAAGYYFAKNENEYFDDVSAGKSVEVTLDADDLQISTENHICDIDQWQIMQEAELDNMALRMNLYNAVSSGDSFMAELALESGANVNDIEDGQPALFRAACDLDLETFRYLLGQGASIDNKTTDGMTALHKAALNGDCEVVRILVKGGASIHVLMPDGKTALHNAALNGHFEVVRLLVNHGASVNIPTHDGKTPLFEAACNGHHEIVDFLLKHGASIGDAMDNDKECPHGVEDSGYFESSTFCGHCVLCRQSVRNREALMRHVEDKHFPRYLYSCPYIGCQTMQTRKDKIQDHIRTHPGIKPGSYLTQELPCSTHCPVCRKKRHGWDEFYSCLLLHHVLKKQSRHPDYWSSQSNSTDQEQVTQAGSHYQ